MQLFYILGALIIAFLLCTPSSIQAQGNLTYFIDTSAGNDANDGLSETKPWKSITKVNAQQFKPGTKVLFKRDQRHTGCLKVNTSGTSGSLIVFGAYGSGNKPEIYCAKPWKPTWKAVSPNIWKVDVREIIVKLNGEDAKLVRSLSHLQNPYEWYRDEQTSSQETYIYSPSDPNSYYGLIEVGSEGYGVNIAANKYIQLQDITVIGGRTYGVNINSGGASGNNIIQNVTSLHAHYSGIVLKNTSHNVVEKSEAAYANVYGIQLENEKIDYLSTSNTIQDNTTYSNIAAGLLVQGYGYVQMVQDTKVLHNKSYNNGDGLYLRYAQNNLVEENEFYDNKRTLYAGGEGYGIGVQTGVGNTIRGNRLYRNGDNTLLINTDGKKSPGIEIWGGLPPQYPRSGTSSANLIEKNYIYENFSYGIQFSSTGHVRDNTIAYNAIYGNKQMGILISHAGNTGNKILNNTVADNLKNALFYYQPARPIIKNNLFIRGSTVTMYSDSDIGPNGFVDAPLKWNGTTVSGADIPSKNGLLIATFEPFPDASNGIFALSSSSVYRDAGVNLNYTSDINNQVIVGKTDIGAFEYSDVGITATPIPLSPSPTTKPTVMPTQPPSPLPGEPTLLPNPLSNYGTRSSPGVTDINKDGVVNILDTVNWLQSL